MKRMYQRVISEHFRRNRQMLFVMGPRQVGKTTIGLGLEEEWPRYHYLTWDNTDHRKQIKKGEQALAEELGLHAGEDLAPVIVFDELHKYRPSKLFLKGLYDTFPFMAHVLVTGSARLDVYQRGADSLMGRFFGYRVHPLTVRELSEPEVIPIGIRPEPCSIDNRSWEALWRFGGFPDPFLRGEDFYHHQWQKSRNELLFRIDLRDLSKVREISQVELLAECIRSSVGSLTSYTSLAKKVQAPHTTIKRWIKWLVSLFYCFEVRPWAGNLPRSLLKEPKYYLNDWSSIKEDGPRAENLVACHLIKACNFWTDFGVGTFHLHYVRDKSKREVDFLVTRDGAPWLLVEVKLNHAYSVSPSLTYFQKQLKTKYALQVVFGMGQSQRPCFVDERPRVVPVRTFLSHLV